MARLTYTPEGRKLKEVPLLPGAVFTIGREHENMLVLDDTTVSRFHAQIEQLGQDFYLVDLGSTNGTRLNGQRVWGKVLIKKNDRIGVGKFEMIFVDEPSDYGSSGKCEDGTTAMPGT